MNSKNYLILEIGPTTKSEKQIVEEIRKSLKGLDVAIIYPTHDKKCYLGLAKGCISDLRSQVKDNLMSANKSTLSVRQVDPNANDDKLSDYGYYHLKKGLLHDLSQGIRDDNPKYIADFVKAKYGFDYVAIREDGTDTQQPAEYMLKLDAYQKRVLEFDLKLETSRNMNDQIDEAAAQMLRISPSSSPLSSLNSSTGAAALPKRTPRNVFMFDRDRDGDSQIRVEIIRGNLVRQQVDVIVNAANSRLILGGGVAGAIASACGQRVQDECEQYLKKSNLNTLQVSQVIHTKAYRIPAKFVIHAVGPRWWDYQDQAQCFFDLAKTFTNVLDYASSQLPGDVSSIAIPLISSGVFGVPRHLCCEALYDAIKSRPDCRLNLIRLVNIDDETTQALLYCFSQNTTPNRRDNNQDEEASQYDSIKSSDWTEDGDLNAESESGRQNEAMNSSRFSKTSDLNESATRESGDNKQRRDEISKSEEAAEPSLNRIKLEVNSNSKAKADENERLHSEDGNNNDKTERNRNEENNVDEDEVVKDPYDY